jgi:hypothetical protein
MFTGEVEISIRNNNNTNVVAIVKKDSLIGEMKPILNKLRTATCIAGNNGAVLIGFTIEQNGYEKHPKAYAKFYRNMSFILAKKIEDTISFFYKNKEYL